MPRVDWEHVQRALASREPARVPEPVASRAAVAAILREGAPGLEILFIRRAEHEGDPWSGQMGFPGGRAEPGEDELSRTAVRETREETGIDLSRDANRLGRLDEVRAMARMRPLDLAITPFVFRLRSRGEAILSEEVRSLHWLPLDGLLASATQSTMQYDYQGTALELPCLRFEGLVIWGLTYRMFTNFQKLLDDTADPGTRLVREPIDIAALPPTTPEDGALCLFVGVVRNENQGRKVLHLEYEAYEDMALPLMKEIGAEARRRWPITELRMVHRLGRLRIGEASVAVAVASPHRAEAFAACRFLIDTLKATVPIWKKEYYADGSAWLEEAAPRVPGSPGAREG